ncbi:MAG: hypothetical protein QOE31_2420 [Solirubrobacteraceae bacterium]|nr:hypothetical protein [Solirubrobacteraceae bacterium]
MGADDAVEAPRRAATFALAAVVAFPLIPWLTAGSLADRFSGIATLKSVANLAALFGIAAWAANLVLASRIAPVERALGGLENLYRLHRRIGVLVVILVATHVVFLALHAGASALDLFVPAAGLSIFSGVIAFVLLIGFVIASIVGRLAYETFLLVQRLLGATFVVGAFHTFAVHGTKASAPLLTAYLAVLTAAGVAGLGYRLFGGRIGVGRHRYHVEGVRRLGDDVVEISMLPDARPVEFQAGQFVYATFHQSEIPREPHPFTIASAPGGDHLRIVVKRFGDFTSSMMSLRPGCAVWLEGPFGRFCLEGDPVNAQTWIAGGIGITPFLSWARSLERALPVDLYYCTPAAEHAHFLDELYDIADRFPTFKVIPIRKSSLGRLSVSDIEAVNPNVTRGHVFMCGPQVLIDNMTSGLSDRGVPSHRIHAECFDFR